MPAEAGGLKRQGTTVGKGTPGASHASPQRSVGTKPPPSPLATRDAAADAAVPSALSSIGAQELSVDDISQDPRAEQEKGLQLGELSVQLEPLDLNAREWSVEEDQFLVRHLGVKKTPLRQLETLYQKTAKSSLYGFTKERPRAS
jgi:hypothetical protein